MKKALVSILVISLFISCITVGFADHNKLTMGMSYEEVQKVMGMKTDLQTSSVDKQYTSVIYKDQKISKFKAVMVLSFKNDALYNKNFQIKDDKNLKAYYYLSKALTKKYGKPILSNKNDRKNLKKYSTFIMGFFGHPNRSQQDNEKRADEMFDLKRNNSDVMLWDSGEKYIVLTYLKIIDGNNYTYICYIDKTFNEDIDTDDL